MPVNQRGISEEPTASSGDIAAVTPSDATEFATMTRGLYVGGAGAVAVLGWEDSAAVTFAAVPAGTILPVRVKKVMSTNTTATNIVALY
jgi:hypothetical protein